MKKLFLLLMLLCNSLHAASVTRGYTFTTNEQVTSAKLHLLVDGASVSSITSSDITDGTIALGDMGANSVDASKVVAGSLTTSQMLSRGLAGTEIATNGISGIELSSNITFRAGFLNFTNSTVGFTNNAIFSQWVLGVTNSTGATDAGKVIKLNDSGVLSTSITPFSASFTSTNIAIVAGGSVVNAHSLGGMPTLIQIRAVEVNGAGSSGYSLNDEVILPFGSNERDDNSGISVVPDASNLNIRFGSAAAVFYLPNKGTGATGSMTPADWKLIIRAWK
jgi:hypothetical protein